MPLEPTRLVPIKQNTRTSECQTHCSVDRSRAEITGTTAYGYHVEVITKPRQNTPVQSHTATVARAVPSLKSMRAAAFQPSHRMLSSDFVPTSPCLVDPWIRPFTIGIAPVFRTPRSVWIRKTSGVFASRPASRRAFKRPLPKALRVLPFQKIVLQPFGRTHRSFLAFLFQRFALKKART